MSHAFLTSDIHQPDAIHLIVLTGMSGGGKTVALRALEDLEFYCVDNLPTALLPELVAAVSHGAVAGRRQNIAVGVDVRNRGEDFLRMPTVLSELAAAGVQVHLVFIDCRDEVLIKRYSETRRRHPLSVLGLSLSDAIAEERKLLRPLIAIAEKVIDSSELNVHQLRRLIATDYAQATDGLTLMFTSFAYRRGLPLDADFVFDARCLPNPHWEPRLRPLSGKDGPVREYLEAQPLVEETSTTPCAGSTPGCRASPRTTAATSPWRSAAPAGGIVRSTWWSGSPPTTGRGTKAPSPSIASSSDEGPISP